MLHQEARTRFSINCFSIFVHPTFGRLRLQSVKSILIQMGKSTYLQHILKLCFITVHKFPISTGFFSSTGYTLYIARWFPNLIHQL
ncbi:hypothetical protein DN53_15960 [Flagellimonas olearia]|uniref:Uncharacterized protein n=1 Tax=Flagellimonas olearia TaxID=552546 RepID=A0A444VK28_9FLAO|nr:hypothetical protein DN53_15960 [Allomuricauda olearia]